MSPTPQESLAVYHPRARPIRTRPTSPIQTVWTSRGRPAIMWPLNTATIIAPERPSHVSKAVWPLAPCSRHVRLWSSRQPTCNIAKTSTCGVIARCRFAYPAEGIHRADAPTLDCLCLLIERGWASMPTVLTCRPGLEMPSKRRPEWPLWGSSACRDHSENDHTAQSSGSSGVRIGLIITSTSAACPSCVARMARR
jgi:hypothetical protein